MRLLRFGLLLFILSAVGEAADWPGWQGAARDNINPEKGLLPRLPAGGPKRLWTFAECGIGFASPSVVGNRLYLPGSAGKDEVLHCLDVQTGKPLWAKPAIIGPIYDNKWGDGPRGSATVDGGLVYCIGGQGNLVCVEAESGKVVWSKSLSGELNGKMMTGWGYSESPLIEGDLVICTPGGSKGTLAALNKKTGAVVWRSEGLEDPAAYASAIAATVGPTRMVIQLTGNGLVGVEAATGKPLWKQPVVTNKIAMIATPIHQDGLVYVSTDYGAGSALVQLKANAGGVQSKVLYESKNLQNHHGGVVLLNGHVYGCSGNTNQRTSWVCQDFQTGKEVWSSTNFEEAGSLTVADGKLFLYGQNSGLVAMVEPSPAGYKELGRFKLPATSKIPRKSGLIWAHPVVANGKLYLRDLDLLYCYDVAAK